MLDLLPGGGAEVIATVREALISCGYSPEGGGRDFVDPWSEDEDTEQGGPRVVFYDGVPYVQVTGPDEAAVAQRLAARLTMAQAEAAAAATAPTAPAPTPLEVVRDRIAALLDEEACLRMQADDLRALFAPDHPTASLELRGLHRVADHLREMHDHLVRWTADGLDDEDEAYIVALLAGGDR